MAEPIWENEDEPDTGPIPISEVPANVPMERLTPWLVEVCTCDECDICECDGGLAVFRCDCECKIEDEGEGHYECLDCDPLE